MASTRKPRGRLPRKPATTRTDPQRKIAALTQELARVRKQQAATTEILRAISSSPSELQGVLRAVAQNAARLCDADVGQILRIDDDFLRVVASYGPIPSRLVGETMRISRGSVAGRAVVDRQTIHVRDLSAELETEFPDARPHSQLWGHRTALATPLLREGVPIGAIFIRRTEVRPFTDEQIELLGTFADQAAIAIENARLFQELQARNRDLTEALEQQTATAEILQVISSSPTDIQPVMDAIAQRAVRLCGGLFGVVLTLDGDLLHIAAHYNFTPDGLAAYRRVFPMPVNRGTHSGRAILDRAPVHVPDVEDDPEYAPEVLNAARILGFRCILSVPMFREGNPTGTIAVSRRDPEPFSDKQIALLKTFADQAVIAISNVRLFQELQARTRELARSVEELKALGEVSQAVSSTLDLETVLTTIVGRADQLSGTDGGAIYEYDEPTEEFRLRVTLKLEDELIATLRATPIRLGEGAVGRAGVARQPVQIHDILEEATYTGVLRGVARRAGYRALLAVPLVREDRLIGALVLRRRVPGPFSQQTVDLLQTFAAQSVLAIQNARLFRELAEKSRDLELASQHKSQFLANMSHELRTPLNAILGYTELILDSIYGEVAPQIREVLERLHKSGRHLLSLINDVLDLSKIEAGQLTLTLADYSLRQVVQTVVTAMEALAAEKHLALKVSLPPDLPPGRGDERRLTQVLLNLVGNAIKFTEAGEVLVEVTAADGVFRVAVTDTGPGIAEADQAKIFEEFQQAAGPGGPRKGGTGLGLAIAKRIVELHGGRIDVTSRPGQGSTFWFTLPVRVERPREGA